MNFTDLAIFLAYFKSDERFYHINPKERLNYSDCVKYCNSLDATLPAYSEKPYIQKFILDVKNGSKSIWGRGNNAPPLPEISLIRFFGDFSHYGQRIENLFLAPVRILKP